MVNFETFNKVKSEVVTGKNKEYNLIITKDMTMAKAILVERVILMLFHPNDENIHKIRLYILKNFYIFAVCSK